MKLLITSVDAIVNLQDNKPFDGIIESINTFKGLEEGNEVVVISSHADKLKLLPAGFPATRLSSGSRGSNLPIESILSYHSDFNTRGKILVLAANDADFRTASNAKILLLGAGHAKINNPDSKAYQYGLQLPSIGSLNLFFERFAVIQNPWYYRLKVDDKTKLYSLTNANTLGGRSNDSKGISESFKRCLKTGNPSTRGAFVTYFIMGIYDRVKAFEDIDVWSIYPSSTVEQSSDLIYFKELARTAFKKMDREPLLVRHTQAVKRSNFGGKEGRQKRLDEGCDNQFETIHLNPNYRGKIANKVIGVIDDFTTFGTSCETVRALLEKAGAAKVVFITLGKFGYEYAKYNYELQGDVFTPNYTFERQAMTMLSGDFNNASDVALLASLKGIV